MAAVAKEQDIARQVAQQSEDTAERRYLAERIARRVDQMENRDWQDAKDVAQRQHEKKMADKDLRSKMLVAVATGVIAIASMLIGKWTERQKNSDKDATPTTAVAPTSK